MGEDPEIVEMQQQWLAANRRRKRWIIVEVPEGYVLHVHTEDGVDPPVLYSSKRAVASRLLQLLGIGPVAPQTWPEEVCIGYVVMEPTPGDQP